MSIFPDDDKRRKQAEDDLAGDVRRNDYPTPTPNAGDAFEGGAIRSQGGSRSKAERALAASKAARIDARRRNDTSGAYKRPVGGFNRGCGCIITLGIGAAIVLPIFFFVLAPMFGWFNVFGEDTRAVPGSETAFDPIASYAEIAAYAQGEAASVDFIEMDAYYVKRDGTMDLTANYNARASWTFVIPAPRPDDAPPVGAGGSPDDLYFQEVEIDAFQPGQMRSVTRTGGGSSTSYTYRHLGLSRDVDEPTNRRQDGAPPPTCSFREMWDVAIQHDAPPEAVAIITYDNGEYDFWIQDTDVRLEFDSQCREM